MVKFKRKISKCEPFLYYQDGFGYIDFESEKFSNIFFDIEDNQPTKIGYGNGECFDGEMLFISQNSNVMFGEPIVGDSLSVLRKNHYTANRIFKESRLFMLDNEKDTILLYNTKQKQNIWEIPDVGGRIFYDDDDFFIAKGYPNKSIVLCFSTQTGALLWEKDVSEIGKVFVRYEDKIGQISKVYGKFEGNLIVSMTKYLLFGINPHTGEVAWQLPKTHGLLPMDNLQFNQDQNKLVCLKGNGFYEIDLASRQITRAVPLKAKMFDKEGNPFDVYGFEVWGNRLIFSGNYLGKIWTSALLGCFNMDTLEFEWTEPVPIDKGEFVAKAPVVAGNKIYLGTSEGTLFVYEMVEEA